MLAEFGHVLLVAAFSISLLNLITTTKFSLNCQNLSMFHFANKLLLLSSVLLICSFLVLIKNYLESNFSLLNVYNNSHSSKPFIYKLSGTWGNHEGSLMMWLAFLGFYACIYFFSIKKLEAKFANYVNMTMSIIFIGFISFTIFTSNPFLRIFPFPSEGLGLNPVLQDPGLAFHPPLLYLGYVGLTVPFSFAIAGLLVGKIDNNWARVVRPWILFAWIFLTLGISLGSFWAYYELGWGGWWFWDPVENISLLPWLLTTALIHSIRVTEKRSNLKTWTVLLCILAFTLTLLGTFIVRSGLLTSVHAFASDPARGVFILTFLFIISAGALLLYAVKYDKIENRSNFFILSKEGGLLLNNIFLCSSAVTILIGTLWPLIIEVFTGQDISVGAPYFNLVFFPLIIPAVYLSGISINLNWKTNKIENIISRTLKVFAISTFLMLFLLLIYGFDIISLLGYSIFFWIIFSIYYDFQNRLKYNSKLQRLLLIKKSVYGMHLAHLGLAIMILGIAVSESKKEYFEGVIRKGDQITLNNYKINFFDEEKYKKENWVAEAGIFNISKGNNRYQLKAERRVYLDTGMPSTEAAIKRTFFDHIYIVMGQEQPQKSGNRVVRVYYNPFILFIWIGAIIMALGGLLAFFERKSK